MDEITIGCCVSRVDTGELCLVSRISRGGEPLCSCGLRPVVGYRVLCLDGFERQFSVEEVSFVAKS